MCCCEKRVVDGSYPNRLSSFLARWAMRVLVALVPQATIDQHDAENGNDRGDPMYQAQSDGRSSSGTFFF